VLIPSATLLSWYCEGVFPMGDPDTGDISLYDPDQRGIISLDAFHVPATLAKTVRAGRYEIRINTAFRDVIAACAREGDSWITGDILQSYVALHRKGWAHSVEAWSDGTLAGGLYGVSIGAAFFGESMFHTQRDASKAALVGLVDRMRERGLTLLDTQYTTPHLERFGAYEISRKDYLRLLRPALEAPVSFFP
jgi:leucyl/phenylalanyl-tRNA--protein transferase